MTKPSKSIQDFAKKAQLWPHQITALGMIEHYLHTVAGSDTDKLAHALVNLPTGCGKTGVIACASRLLKSVTVSVVLAPRVALRDQLHDQIKSAFFESRNVTDLVPPALVVRVEQPTDWECHPPTGSRIIYVGTLQAADSYRRRAPTALARLAPNVDLIFVDEGHYEPAPSWSKTVRDLGRPTVLFSATPYRNDLKVFKISEEHISLLRMREAVDRGIVRKIVPIKRARYSPPGPFVSDVLAAFEEHIGPLSTSDYRCIIRCDDANEIRKIAGALESRRVSYCAVHETFQNGVEPHFFNQPPKPKTNLAKVWVHQFKLLEGIDDPTFRMVAFYKPVRNTRSIIQQIGRVLRNPSQTRGEEAFVLDHSGGHIQAAWDRYLRYDVDITKVRLVSSSVEKVRGLYRRELTCAEYIDRNFRTPFLVDQKDFDVEIDVLAPRTAHFIHKTAKFAAKRMNAMIKRTLEEDDCPFLYQRTRNGSHVYLFMRVDNSSLLKNHYFFEPTLGLIIWKDLASDFISFFASSGWSPMQDDDMRLGPSLHRNRLHHVIRGTRGGPARTTTVSSRNANLGVRAIRTRSISAASIEQSTPMLDEHQHILTSITAYSSEKAVIDDDLDPEAREARKKRALVRRYLGFTHGRVSETGSNLTLGNYERWVEFIKPGISLKKRSPLRVFDRYSDVAKTTPAKPRARNILIDFHEASETFVLLNSRGNATGAPLYVEDACLDCDQNPDPEKPLTSNTTIVANGHRHPLKIIYDPTRGRYHIEANELAKKYVARDGLSENNLVAFLNRNQAFTVIPESTGYVYAHDRFYDPRLKIGEAFSEDANPVVKCLFPLPKLLEISSEKGRSCRPRGAGWEKGSLFDFISTGGEGEHFRKLFAKADLIVCADLGTEIADFLFASPTQVVAVHAKSSEKKSPYSATKLQTVLAQALKNAAYLQPFSEETPANLKDWAKPWVAHGIKGSVAKRILRGPQEPRAAWDQIRLRLGNPNIDREIWLVMGNAFSRSSLIEELGKRRPQAESYQAATLLMAGLTSIQQFATRFRVFCMP